MWIAKREPDVRSEKRKLRWKTEQILWSLNIVPYHVIGQNRIYG